MRTKVHTGVKVGIACCMDGKCKRNKGNQLVDFDSSLKQDSVKKLTRISLLPYSSDHGRNKKQWEVIRGYIYVPLVPSFYFCSMYSVFNLSFQQPTDLFSSANPYALLFSLRALWIHFIFNYFCLYCVVWLGVWRIFAARDFDDSSYVQLPMVWTVNYSLRSR